MSTQTDQSNLVERLRRILGPKGWLDDPDDLEPYVTEWRGFWRGSCLGAALPDSTEQVSQVVKACNETQTPVTPIGGNTGLVGGGVPNGGIVVATKRLNRVIGVDPANQTMTVEAGCILADIQAHAEEADLLFPLSLGAEGTCQVGGNLSTNAGGVGVLRYGNARDLTLGLEVVLPSGEIWNGMTGLRKDNTGYDLKHLFMGAEGTLGIITGAVLKLFPAPKSRETAVVALPSVEAALDLFVQVRAISGDNLTAFEILNAAAMSLVNIHIPDARNPFAETHPCYALVELTSSRETDDLRSVIETSFTHAFDEGSALDAVLAENEQQKEALWRIRETIPEAQVLEGASIKHDVSVPVSSVPAFVNAAEAKVAENIPGARIVAFGHMGDGNLHYNLTVPENGDGEAFLAKRDEINNVIHDLVVNMNGSFSAEHGIGQLKRDDLGRYGSVAAISAMRAIKSALDPNNIMNPGKVIPTQGQQ